MMKLTLKQKKWLAESIKLGSATEAAWRVYDCTTRKAASQIAWENKKKLDIRTLLELEAKHAYFDNIEIRDELKKSKTNDNLRNKINDSVLDRAGYTPIEKTVVLGAHLVEWEDT